MRTIRFECKCRQAYEVPREMAGKWIACNECKLEVQVPTPEPVDFRDLAILIAVFGLIWIGAMMGMLQGIRKETSATEVREELTPETDYEREARLTTEAAAALTNYCEKDIVGFKRIVEAYAPDGRERKPGRFGWKGSVVAEYVNHVGGIDRTNLPLAFSTTGIGGRSHVYCYEDGDEIFKRWQRENGIVENTK